MGIPHDTGMESSKKLNNEDIIKKKCAMLDSLLEVEKAMKVMEKVDSTKKENVYDQHYAKLDCDITPLAKEDEMWKTISDSIKNTHASTHDSYVLKVDEIYSLKKEK